MCADDAAKEKSAASENEAVYALRVYLQYQGLTLEDNGDITQHGEKVAVADMDGLRYDGETLDCSIQVITPINCITTTVTLERAEDPKTC